MMSNKENLKYDNAAPQYKVKKCQSMLEMNEIAIIHQLNEDFGDINVDECYGHVGLEERGTSAGEELKGCVQEFDSSTTSMDRRRKTLDLSSNNSDRTSAEVTKTVTSSTTTILKASTSTVSIVIPEESELKDDSILPDCTSECKSTNEIMQVDNDYEDMDNSRHSYSLNLGFDLDTLNLNLEKDTKDGLTSTANGEKKAGGGWLPTAICDKISNDCNHAIDEEEKDCDQVRLSQNPDPYALTLGLGLDEESTGQAIEPKPILSDYTSVLCPIPREIEDTTTFLDNNDDNLPMKNKKNGSLVKSIKKSVSMLNLSSLRKNKKSINIDELTMTNPCSKSPDQPPRPLKSILKKSSPSPSSPDDPTMDDDSTNLSPSIDHLQSNKIKRVTSFSNIEIREYDITLGDNPGGAGGPPISLDWKYNDAFTQVMEVDQYEEYRPPRRTRLEMHMCSSVRSYRLMKEQGFTLDDMRKAAKSANDIRKQRNKTLKRVSQRDALKQTLSKLLPIKVVQ